MDQAVSDYCERTGAGLLAEPLNALTNAAFLVAALLALRELRRSRTTADPIPWDVVLGIALLAAVGLGSALWHTLATPWAALADSLPILLLVSILLGSFLRRLFGWSGGSTAAAVLAVGAASFALGALLPTAWRGSLAYAPTWTALVLLAAAAAAKGFLATHELVVTSVLFSISLLLRTADLGLCGGFRWGTHWAWHLLNALVLYRLLHILIQLAAQRAARAPNALSIERSEASGAS